MDIKDMTMEQVEARAEEIREAQSAEDADLEALAAEAEQLAARRSALIEEQKAAQEAVARGAGEVIKREDKNMTEREVRQSKAYIEAYANYVKGGCVDDTECRSILTENAGTVEGATYVPAPVFVEDIIAEKRRESKILSRVRTVEVPGTVKVGVEMDAPMAEVHTEGGQAVAEEALELAIVTLSPVTLKKWVSVTDEVMDMTGEAFLRYLYDDIARGLIKKAEAIVISGIESRAATPVQGMPAVASVTGTLSLTTIIEMRAHLNADAEDLVLIMNASNYAAIKALAAAAHYAFDPFDGIEAIIDNKATGIILGDLSGVMVNYPAGRDIQYKFDDKTLMTEDMVRVLGRLPIAAGIVGNRYFVVAGESDGGGDDEGGGDDKPSD